MTDLTAEGLYNENNRIRGEDAKFARDKKTVELSTAMRNSGFTILGDVGTIAFKGLNARPQELIGLVLKLGVDFGKHAMTAYQYASHVTPKPEKEVSNPVLSAGGAASQTSAGTTPPNAANTNATAQASGPTISPGALPTGP